MFFSALRVFFTLRHTTVHDVLASAFAPDARAAGGEASEALPPGTDSGARMTAAIYNTIPVKRGDALWTISQPALTRWVDRYSGFGEWPIKRPIEMVVEIHGPSPDGDPPRVVRFCRRFGGPPSEIRRVLRSDDVLFQDNDVPDWCMTDNTGPSWSAADLDGATVRVRAAYLSFHDINFQRPPRLCNLHLYFGGTSPAVLFFTREQLESPLVGEDPAPLLRSRAFKTLLLEYRLPLSGALLAKQLLPLRPA